jgi:hypothetical protein
VAVVLLIAGVAALACFGGLASAADVHVYSHSFGAGELKMTWESGIDINQETGKVYVADTEHSRIAKFTAAGAPDGSLATTAEPTSIAVDNSSGPSKGDIYVLGQEDRTITKLDPSGSPVAAWGTGGKLGGLDEIIGIAVSSTGNLWVLSQDLKLNEIDEPFLALGAPREDTITSREFDQAGSPVAAQGWVKKYSQQFYAAQSDTAVDSAENMYVASIMYANGGNRGERRWWERYTRQPEKLDSTGKVLLDRFGSGPNLGIGTDLADGRVYLGEVPAFEGNLSALNPPTIYGYSLTGKQLERFGGDYEGTVYQRESSTAGLQDIASIAVNEATHSVYVADPQGDEVAVFETEEVEPPTVAIDAPDAITQTSAHVVGHIDPNAPGGSPSSHGVAWSFKCVPACPGHEGYFEADGQEHTVEATIGGLKAGWEYSVSLIARNRGGEVESAVESFPTAPAAPGVSEEFAADVRAGEATLKAAINPNGAATTYHFEYMTKVAFEAEGFGGSQTHSTPESEPIEPLRPDPLDPAADPELPRVSARVSGLEAATDYLYRAVATNSVGTTNGEPTPFRSQVGKHSLETDCPNQALRTDVGARLPDCRAYEMASPTDKRGSMVEPYEAWLQASPDGSSVNWYTGEAASGVPSAGEAAHQDPAFYLSSLAAGNWSSQRLLPPESLGERGHFSGLSADGRYAVLESSERSGHGASLYLLDTADQSFSTIVAPQVGEAGEYRAFAFDGASGDDSLFFFESALQLTSNAAAGKDNLYVWNRQSGALTLAGVLPGTKGEAPDGGSYGGAEGGAMDGLYVGALHAISKSGDRAYFTAGESGQLYLRAGLTGAKPSTVRVSVANAGVHDANGQKPAVFQAATPEGGKVFFTSAGKLTEDANTGSADEGNDLYRYDAEAKKLVDVTALAGGPGARVQGLLGIAEDGGSGYLAAKGVLAAGGVAGKNNVYHFEEAPGGAFSFQFVTALAAGERNWSANTKEAKTARVSADGSTLLFLSDQQLTGGPQGKCVYGVCAEVYRYSAAEGSLACVSCNPSIGAGAPVIGAELSTQAAPNLVPENYPLFGTLPRNLSSSGTRVFFQSSEALLPEDVNGQNCTSPFRCGDVYEWEAVGSGSCKAAEVNGGCLYLLSSGESGESSYFVDASEEGASAFIITGSKLVPADRDELSDVYSVRVGGGLASQHVVPSGSCGSAEACKGAGSNPAPAVSPGTQSFQGPGNPPAVRRCKKGFARRHGRCVKQRKHQAKKHKSHKSRAAGSKRSGGGK